MAISILYNPSPLTLYEADGDRASGALAYFYLARTTTPLAVYLDAPLATPHPWPVVASAYGLLPPVYIAKGTEYKVRITDADGNLLYAADGIDNPAEPTAGDEGGGGGGGLVVTADQIAATGDFVWQPVDAARNGWVRCNGDTISSVIGPGTERRNADCETLFAFLWNGFDDAKCPVGPGGRGANAAADWAANKGIATLDMRGRGAAGLDTMGATAAGLIQKTTTIDTTNTSATATVASGVGIAAGMFVIAAGVTAGTKVVAINGTTITLSAAATATATGVAVRFSHFADATVAGAAGGENTHRMEYNELAAHTHAMTTSGAGDDRLVGLASSGTTWDMLPAAITGGVNDVTNVVVTAASTGSNSAMNTWSPAVLGTWFCKL